MIPLRDTIPARSYPFVTVALIVANVAVFLHELSLGPYLEQFIYAFGFVPARYHYLKVVAPGSVLARLAPIVTSMFLHGGWLHLIGNMWILWIFGDNVEDRLGKARYLGFYLACGVAAAYTHYWMQPLSDMPTVGASGAIAGVMGGYFVLFPQARVLTLVPILFYPVILFVPAVTFLGLWFFLQLFNGTFAVATADMLAGGVAWWAHVGGFVAGVVLVRILVRRDYVERRRDEYAPW
ncbi:MAG TPA: rhomboid family intramembrane serine protease [Candidatus Binatus sp.]|nr:rhomboid family intramembrane serine protease [Candidatus Binatus sp.]